MDRLLYPDLDAIGVDLPDQAGSTTQEYRSECDLQFVHQTSVQILHDRVSAAGHTDIPPGGDLPRSLQSTVDPVVDEIEGGATGSFPGLSLLVGDHEDWGVERCLFWPRFLASVEHPLP